MEFWKRNETERIRENSRKRFSLFHDRGDTAYRWLRARDAHSPLPTKGGFYRKDRLQKTHINNAYRKKSWLKSKVKQERK